VRWERDGEPGDFLDVESGVVGEGVVVVEGGGDEANRGENFSKSSHGELEELAVEAEKTVKISLLQRGSGAFVC